MKAHQVLVVASHADDETLGCGGAILRHLARGDRVHWCLVTAPGERLGWTGQQMAAWRETVEAVREAYPFAGVHQLGLPACELDGMGPGAVAAALGRVLDEVRPEVVYLPFLHDVHSDHRVVFQAGWSAVKTFRRPFVRRVLMMEVPSETDFAPGLPGAAFAPNVFVDVTAHFRRKLEIAGLYASEMGERPFPRSPEILGALAALRGARAGVAQAEGFMLLQDLGPAEQQ